MLKMMKKYFLGFFLAGLMMPLAGQTILDTALNFSVKDPYGNTLELFNILEEDKIVVIDFFSVT